MHAPSLPDQSIEGYAEVVDADQFQRLRDQAATVDDRRILHLNSTATGGGVAELLRSIVPLSNDLGVETDWLVMDATDEFFDVTKAMHNGLQGDGPPLTDEMRETYREVNESNVAEFEGDYDVIVVHDPQPLGMIDYLTSESPNTAVVWRCHIDLTEPESGYLAFISSFTDGIDHAVFSRSAYARAIDLSVPTSVIYPAIDPLSEKNRSLDENAVAAEHDRLDPLAFDAPVISQISRFDPWKDQFGTLEAFRRCKDAIPDVQLALAGGMAGDDPEGLAFYERIAAEAVDEPDVHVLTDLPDTRVNVLQRSSDVVIQKSLREGFGLVVAEALWKRTPVVGSDVGGISLQIIDGETGYLVERTDVRGVADRVETLLGDEDRRHQFGLTAREHIRDQFLLPRQLIDLLSVIDRVS